MINPMMKDNQRMVAYTQIGESGLLLHDIKRGTRNKVYNIKN